MGTSVFPGLLAQNGGQLLSPNYYGMWGGNVWFVDYDYGTAGGVGDSPSSACKNLQTILDKASAWDTIYIRPRDPDSTGGDPQAIIPVSTTNFSFAYTLHGLSIIGTGNGVGKAAFNQTRLQAASGASATPTLYAKAPFTTFENLTFRRGGSTTAGLKIATASGDSAYAFGCTVNRCGFWKISSTATAGAFYLDSAWHCNIMNTQFEQCAKGLVIGTNNSEVDGLIMENVLFNGPDSVWDVGVLCAGDVDNFYMANCVFAQDQPALSGGATLKYISVGATSTGQIYHCGFGTESGTISTAMTNGNIDIVDSWYAPGTNLTDGT